MPSDWIRKRNFAEIFGEIVHRGLRKRRGRGLMLRGRREGAQEGSRAVGDADPGAEDEGVALFESDDRLDDDWSHRVRRWILGKLPYPARQLSVFSPGNLPRGLPEVDDCGGARRDQELDGETRGTQLDRFGPQFA